MSEFKCPKCSSNNILSGKKGFGYTRAIGGALLLGPIGALLGGSGRNKIILHCMECDHRWDHSSIIKKKKEKEELAESMEDLKKQWKKTGDQWKNLFKGK
jgi:hypothetical protein